MPLPEKVIEQLGREPTGTQGWAVGALLFSGGLFFLALLIYAGLAFGYEPYLQSQLQSEQNQMNALSQSIPGSDQAQLIDYYSQIANLQSLLQDHVDEVAFFSWLEKDTEANIYYQSFALTGGDRVSLAGMGLTEADVNQQIAIFENAPEVSAVTVSNVTAPETPGSGWGFSITLTIEPSALSSSVSSGQ
jgi:hypothetical protein